MKEFIENFILLCNVLSLWHNASSIRDVFRNRFKHLRWIVFREQLMTKIH